MIAKLTRKSVLALLILAASCSKDVVNKSNIPTRPGGDTVKLNIPVTLDNNNLLLGNPTTANAILEEDFLIDQYFYIESYSKSRAIPNWTSWHLQSEDYNGTAKRQDDFRPYTGLPAGWYAVGAGDFNYASNGFDRGHNCPSGDRTSSVAANSSTFYMTNMIPQASSLNQVPWSNLEDFIRSTLGSSKEAFVVMGSYGKGGTGSGQTGVKETIDNAGKIVVPRKVWKIVVIIDKQDGDLARIHSNNTTVIAVDMPNRNELYTGSGKATAWRGYLTSVKNLEDSVKANTSFANFDLMRNINDSIKVKLKAQIFQ
ncbi:MAG: DNA/RNA non-specific endonuclease [Filimonas sp.]|nr:DNA/RNA non-specific endonuclease [Filimonas sp.]